MESMPRPSSSIEVVSRGSNISNECTAVCSSCLAEAPTSAAGPGLSTEATLLVDALEAWSVAVLLGLSLLNQFCSQLRL